MQVIKRDGTHEDVKIEKILHAVNRACRGLPNVEAIEVAKRTISGLHEGSTTAELDALSIANAVMLMPEEPNYSKVAARMLAESVHKEVGRDVALRSVEIDHGRQVRQVADLFRTCRESLLVDVTSQCNIAQILGTKLRVHDLSDDRSHSVSPYQEVEALRGVLLEVQGDSLMEWFASYDSQSS